MAPAALILYPSLVSILHCRRFPSSDGVHLPIPPWLRRACSVLPARAAASSSDPGAVESRPPLLGDDMFGRRLAAILRDNGEREFMFYHNPASCRSVLQQHPAGCRVVRRACLDISCRVPSLRAAVLPLAGHGSVLRSPRSSPLNRWSRSTRQSHLGRLLILYSPWYNTAVRSDLQTVMAFIVLWSQPDPSMHSLFVHRASRVLAFVVELLNPSSLAHDFIIARALTRFVSSSARSRHDLVVVLCVIKQSQESGEDEASSMIFTKCSTTARTSCRASFSSTPSREDTLVLATRHQLNKRNPKDNWSRIEIVYIARQTCVINDVNRKSTSCFRLSHRISQGKQICYSY
jgi:hypothetical protein